MRFTIDLDALVATVTSPDAPTEAELTGCADSLVDNALTLSRQDPVIAFGVLVRALISFAGQSDNASGLLGLAIADLGRAHDDVRFGPRVASQLETGPYRRPPSDDTLDMPTEDD